MSRRYGRNQKRKHRDEIARLNRERQILISWEQAKYEERMELERRNKAIRQALEVQRSELNRLVDEIRSVVRHSALLNPDQVDLPTEHDSWHLITEPETRTILFDDSLTDTVMISIVDVHEVRVFMEEYADLFRKLVHVIIPDRQSWRYALSMDAFRHLSRLGRVAEVIFTQLKAAIESSPSR